MAKEDVFIVRLRKREVKYERPMSVRTYLLMRPEEERVRGTVEVRLHDAPKARVYAATEWLDRNMSQYYAYELSMRGRGNKP